MKLELVQESRLNRRFRVNLEDGSAVEAVLYHGASLCVSSQVGCAVGCPFCASGRNGLLRPLSLEELVGQVGAALEGVVEVRLGAEIALNSESVEALYTDSTGPNSVPTLAGSRYVLLELDWQGYGPDALEVVHELVVRGLRPIIAHPERVGWLTAEEGLLESLVQRGATLQLTAMSVTGGLGRRLQRFCDGTDLSCSRPVRADINRRQRGFRHRQYEIYDERCSHHRNA